MVRTRIAPSPTGDPHVGTAYVALFNYCFAKSQGGQFILRIEDTDQVRSTNASKVAILETLKWLGITWDEGPDVGGPHGPYTQSERSALYTQHAAALLASGHAFRCFCTPQRLSDVRKEQMSSGGQLGYDGHCIHLAQDEVARRLADGEPHVVRMVVPREGDCVFQDMLRGTISIPWAQVDMQVLLKSDGLPTYHLANVVDDHFHQITHVMRGEEWINSAPKHLLLYDYFGWDAPMLCHLPLLRNADRSKLSKRKNPTSLYWFRDMGFNPKALLNYLGLMAWSMPDESELFSLDEMVAAFDIQRVSPGGPIFDITKLRWLNKQWSVHRTSDAEWVEQVMGWRWNKAFLQKIAPLARGRAETMGDVVGIAGYLLQGDLDVSAEALLKTGDAPTLIRWLVLVETQLSALPDFDQESIELVFKTTAIHEDAKLRKFVAPFYLALSGSTSSLPLFTSCELLGRDLVRHRLRGAIDTLGGASKKLRAKLEKEVRTIGVT